MLKLLRITTTPTEHEEKKTWLELFFDLVYVVILVALALWGGGLNPALLVALISLIFAALVAIDVAARLRQRGELQASEDHLSNERPMGSVSTSP